MMFRSNVPDGFCLTILVLASVFVIQAAKNSTNSGINDLQASGDYRSIKLKWNYFDNNDADNVSMSGFKIKYCEMNNWPITKGRCRFRVVKLEPNITANGNHQVHTGNDTGNEQEETAIIELKHPGKNHYEASINSLRVQTNYSVSVEATNQAATNPKPYHHHPITNPDSVVVVSTKSFTARTLRCLANSSQIQVFTGPYFKGRITVEGVDNPVCYLDGDGSDPRESYNFTIDHDQCKSKIIDKTRIETMILVNENREILTHNSRRYLVICGFDPDKYTLTASVAVPNFLLKKIFDRLKDPINPSSEAKQETFRRNGLVEKLSAIKNNKN